MGERWTERELDDLIRYLFDTKMAPLDGSPELKAAIDAIYGQSPKRQKIYLIVDNTQPK